jgi:hypothetical protein
MYALIVEESDVTSITIHNHLEDATDAYEEKANEDNGAYLLKVGVGKPFGLNEIGTFGGEEINSNV